MSQEKIIGSGRSAKEIHEQQIVDNVRDFRDNFVETITKRDRYAFNDAFATFSELLQKKYWSAYLDTCRLWHLMAGSTPLQPCTMIDFPNSEDSVIKFLKDYINEHPTPTNPAIIKKSSY